MGKLLSKIEELWLFSRFPLLREVYLNFFKKFDKRLDLFSGKIVFNDLNYEGLRNENIFLFRLLCWIVRINVDSTTERMLMEKLEDFLRGLKKSLELSKGERKVAPGDKIKALQNLENRTISRVTNYVYTESKSRGIENVFTHNKRDAQSYLTGDASVIINFRALEDFYQVLRLYDDPKRLVDFPKEKPFRKGKRARRSARIPKNFKGGTLRNRVLSGKTHGSLERLKSQINTLKQVEFLLKNKKAILEQKIKISDLNLNKEVKLVMFSYYNPVGPYGPDTRLYKADLQSKNKLAVSRRIKLVQNVSPVSNLGDLKTKVGFFNFNVSKQEEWENSIDVPLGGWFTGQFYFINPLVVLGFLLYSVLELLILFYFMSRVFGLPWDTIHFFLKYPSVYFYEHLTAFPSPNYFFSALAFWFFVLIFFQMHILELLDEERFEPPEFSWSYNFSKDSLHSLLILWCVMFCLFEAVSVSDLFFTRMFFVGTPGYPQPLAVLFLVCYDIFELLSVTGYFSFYTEGFLAIDVKYPALYFSDFTPFLNRYPLVQPHFFGNPYFDRPNFFLWLFDSFINVISGEDKKLAFFGNDSRFIFQRELVQDVRKYNFVRHKLTELEFVGQLHIRGWNGYNYRLDLQTIIDPIIPSEQVLRFDWRFKNTHSTGLHGRTFKKAVSHGFRDDGFVFKKRLRFLRGHRRPSKYGYLDYFHRLFDTGQDSKVYRWRKKGGSHGTFKRKAADFFDQISPRSRRSYSRFQDSKKRKRHHRVKSFLFSPSKVKFGLVRNLNRPLKTKADRNFKHSKLFLKNYSFWSLVPGNSKPRKAFYHKSFVPLDVFSKLPVENYILNRLSLDKSIIGRGKLKPLMARVRVNPYLLRNVFLENPKILFPSKFSEEKNLYLQYKNLKFNKVPKGFLFEGKSTEKDSLFNLRDPKYLRKSNKFDFGVVNKRGKSKTKSLHSKDLLFPKPPKRMAKPHSQVPHKVHRSRSRANYASWLLWSKQDSGSQAKNFVSDSGALEKKKNDDLIKKKHYRPSRLKKIKKLHRVRTKISINKLPDYPLQEVRKKTFFSRIYSNFEPKYLLRPTATFTTFSRIEKNSFNSKILIGTIGSSIPMAYNSGLSYPLGLLFSGFSRFLTGESHIKFIEFDYYYSENHNFFYSLVDNYVKRNQFKTMLTYNARFNHPLQGGLRYGLDFMYPMLSELRLKEKLIPLDFFYKGPVFQNYRHLRLDPYENIRNSKFSKGPCYYLDMRIQNWLNFTNVIWNDYYHFFFNRSYKTEGSGSNFFSASFNPISGPASYKLFVGSPTLEVPRVGQFFYNYIPWLQYKFKWLLHPTATYKRFDSFRAIQQHSNKKFYFASLLKFYQMNLFRWQQAAQIFQWNQVQSRNFLIHLFFHKYAILSYLQELLQLFNKGTYESIGNERFKGSEFFGRRFTDNIGLGDSDSIPFFVRRFNNVFFNSKSPYIQLELGISNKNEFGSVTKFPASQLYVPSFTTSDFRFFQYATDLRRWKALQTSYMRDWKYERYMKYLGPLLYKEDVASLMGFFAPFEYRNQIFVSRLRNDSLRFSVFFPKKVIDEQFSNPLKKLKFPYDKRGFSRFRSPVTGKFRNRSKPSFYAFVINRPFVLKGPNYTPLRNQKKVLKGYYPHFGLLNFDSRLNINYGRGFSDSFFSWTGKSFGDIFYGVANFMELNSKRKRLLKDSDFWLSKSYELKKLRDSISPNKTFQHSKAPRSFDTILAQLGKPLDLTVPMAFRRLNAVGTPYKKTVFDSSAVTSIKTPVHSAVDRGFLRTILYPDIFKRFGGAKATSVRWNSGGSWLKYVIASQNVTTRPMLGDLSFGTQPDEILTKDLFNHPQIYYHLNAFGNLSREGGINRLGHEQTPGHITHELRRKYGYFNFGLSGIGRLPRLSRSFFHMLFFRNKLDDFKKLKVSFLRVYLMSVPLLHNTDFHTNESFKLFWSFLLGFYESKISFLKTRYHFLFNTSSVRKDNPDLSSFIYHPLLGSLVDLNVSYLDNGKDLLILPNQYGYFKAFDRFSFFSRNGSSIEGFSDCFINFMEENSLKSPQKIFEDSNAINGSLLLKEVFFLLKGWPSMRYTFPWVSGLKEKFSSFSLKIFVDFFNHSNVYQSKDNFLLLYADSRNFENRSNFFNKIKMSHVYDRFTIFKSSVNLSTFYSSSFGHLTFENFYKARLYFGTYRSHLHWYGYPVHYFFFLKYYLSKSFFQMFYDFFIMNLTIQFRYGGKLFKLVNGVDSFLSFIVEGKNPDIFYFTNNLSEFLSSKSRVAELSPQSDFFEHFYRIYLGFFRFSSRNFIVKLEPTYVDVNFLKNLFLHKSNISDLKNVSFLNDFFFSAAHLQFLSNLNFKTVALEPYSIQNDFVLEFDKFSNNLIYNSKTLDGSGRFHRPKGLSQTLDKIFTYREYEKYRKEHHRQRFRSISPHWIQNTRKNRLNFRQFYNSPDRQRHRMLFRKVRRMATYNSRFKRKTLRKNLRKLSTIRSSLDLRFLANLIGDSNDVKRTGDSNILNFSKDNSSVNFVDIGKRDSLLGKVSSSYDLVGGRRRWKKRRVKFDKYTKLPSLKYQKIAERSRTEDTSGYKDFENTVIPSGFRFDTLHLRPKMVSPARSYSYRHFKDLYGDKEFFKSLKNRTKLRFNKTKNIKKNKEILNFLIEARRKGSENFRSSKKDTRYVLPQLGFDKSGINFVNTIQGNPLHDVFQSVSSYYPEESVVNKRTWQKLKKKRFGKSRGAQGWRKRFKELRSLGFFSESRLYWLADRSQRRSNFLTKTDIVPPASLRHAVIEPYNKTDPNYLKSLSKKRHGFYPNSSVGGFDQHSRRGNLVAEALPKSRRFRGMRGYKRLRHAFSYSPNAKRFIRPFNKVVMYIPYLYSRWFTQNPRLSASVDPEMLRVFVNNQYDEFNYICVQSLLLLKRKIMYDVINLKLISQKQKLLYFTQLQEDFESSLFFRIKHFNFRRFLVKKILILYFCFYDFFANTKFSEFLNILYNFRSYVIDLLFRNNSSYIRLLYNPTILKFRHDSSFSSDMLFFEEYYYKQTAKRILSQIAFVGHSAGGWNNPLGVQGHYIPGLNFFFKSGGFFNFNYQQPDIFSGRFYSPEILLDNNLIRQNNTRFDRDYFFNEFLLDASYKRAWHFLSYRISSPVSPFFEYDRLSSHKFPTLVKKKHSRYPLTSLRRVYNIYPNHLSSFFSTLLVEPGMLFGHDVTLPLKLKLLNYDLRKNPIYRRELDKFFINRSPYILDSVNLFKRSLNLRYFNILTDVFKRVNLSNLTNKRRFAIRRNVWSPFRYNVYFKLNWRTFLHKSFFGDEVGYRNYKLNPFMDLHQGRTPSSLKAKALQHLIVSQVPRFEMDSRRRVPLNITLKEFTLLLFNYFKYVNTNFRDSGNEVLDRRIFKYVNRKVHPFLLAFQIDTNYDWKPLKNYQSIFSQNRMRNSHLKPRVFPVKLKVPRHWRDDLFLDTYFSKKSAFISYQKAKHLESKSTKLGKFIVRTEFILEDLFFKLKKFKNVFSNGFYGLYGSVAGPLQFRWLKKWSFNSRVRNYFYSVPDWFKAPDVTSQQYSKYPYLRVFPFYFSGLRRTPSRIFGIYELFKLKQRKERYLDPASWLDFDLFSRLRPSFKPFVVKFSKQFMFSKYVPRLGIPSYSAFVRSHTAFDNFFERHPYLSFGVGAFMNNDLLGAEGSFKEVRKRSYMLDFSRLHHRGRLNILNDFNDYRRKTHGGSKSKKRQKFRKASPFFFKGNNEEVNHEGKISERFGTPYISGSPLSFVWEAKDATKSVGKDKHPLRVKRPRQYGHFYAPRRLLKKALKSNSVYSSVMYRPERRSLFLNVFLVRPYNTFLNFNRNDNLFSVNWSPFSNERLREYYQPNLKVFFDFNAYKQRYNLGLLFRELSFERDIQFFLFQNKRISNVLVPHEHSFKLSWLLADFTKFSQYDFFDIVVPQDLSPKGFVNASKTDHLFLLLEKYLFKFNPLYIFLILIDFYLSFFFVLMTLVRDLHFLNFSVFINLFDFDQTFIYYVKKRSVFQVFFHVGFFKEYVKFYWLFSLRFLIFNIEYYPYYFFTFTALLIMRSLSYNLQRNNHNSPFVVPYVWRFSDVKLQASSGWFDTAWTELKYEALTRANRLNSSSNIKLNFEYPLTYEDIMKLRQKHKIKDRGSLFEFDESEISLSKYKQVPLENTLLSKSIIFKGLKGFISKIKTLNFLLPSVENQNSDSFQNLDNDLASSRYPIRFATKSLGSKVSTDKKSTFDLTSPDKILEETTLTKGPLSFFLLKKNLALLFKGKVSFAELIGAFKYGDLLDLKSGKSGLQYTEDDFNDDFDRLFLGPNSEFNFFIDENLRYRRMFPDDENIHFYRKPGSILQTEMMSRRTGTETDQLHYVIEFPGKFNNTYINTFSKFHAIRNLNYGKPIYGFFSFPRNAKLPTNFQEFLVFCSYSETEAKKLSSLTEDPQMGYGGSRVARLRKLWALFQHVTKHEYNMFNDYNTEDVLLMRHLFENRMSLLDNFKFWVNKASVDALDFGFYERHFLRPFEYGFEDTEEDEYLDGNDTLIDRYDGSVSKGRVVPFRAFTSGAPLFSVFHLLRIYLVLFLFFMLLSIAFCFFFLFLFSLYNYFCFYIL